MALLDAGEASRKQATTSATQDERARSWSRWTTFLDQIGLRRDPFLSTFPQTWSQNLLISAFAQVVREGSFSRRTNAALVEGTVRTTVDNVAQAFRAHHRSDPRLDPTGKTAFLLQQQFRGYRNTDRNAKQQKALPACVLRQLATRKTSAENIAIAQLATGAFFFAMRSCEYLQTNLPEDKRRTKILRQQDIRFFTKGKLLAHSNNNLAMADTVSITFEFQKSDERHETITMHRSGDTSLCPVRAWAAVIQRIRSYPNTDPSTTVNTILVDNKLARISSSTMLSKLRSAVRTLGETKLGFKAEDIGTHSLRSGAAMAMYLADVATFTIMMIGRWSSDAFLRYIRKQVEQFSHNVSIKMIRNENFFTTPDFAPTVSRHDTRTPNDPSVFATSNNGTVAPFRARFALHH